MQIKQFELSKRKDILLSFPKRSLFCSCCTVLLDVVFHVCRYFQTILENKISAVAMVLTASIVH